MTKTTTLLAASASAFALLATAPAFAQSSADDVIIISATKRDTTLQETPVAVTVTTADVIEKAQILDIKDLQSVVPTFRVSQLQNAGNTTLTIRGFGNGGNNIGIEPSVGLFIDGVYRSRAAAQIGDLPNLQRVEVLSGPQSTLFGKNASAGVVSVVTAKPDFDANGYVEGGIGNYGLNYAKGYITGGLTDTLAVSLGGGYQDRGGYFEPAAGTSGGDFNDLGRFNIRAQALWEPTDNLSARFIWDQSKISENCCGVTTAIVGPTAGIVNALGGIVPAADGEAFSYETAVNRETDNDITDGGVSLQLDWDLDLLGGMTFTSITSNRENSYDYNSDSDFNTLSLLENTFQFVDIDTFTQEFRLTSNNGGPLAWMVGGYYFDENIEQDSGFVYGNDLRGYIDALASIDTDPTSPTAGIPLTFVNGPTASPLFGIEQALGFETGAFFEGGTGTREDFRQDNEAFSIFGTLDFDVTDRLTLTLGGNYTEDKKNVSASTVNSDAFSNVSLTGAQGTALVQPGVADAIATGLFTTGNPDAMIPSFMDALGLDFTPENLAAAQSGAFGAAAQGYVEQVLAGANAAAGPIAAGLAADEVNGPFAGLLALQFQPQFLAFPNAIEDGRTRDDEFTYTLKAAYEINDNFNAYVSTATGFKASSFNLTRDSRPFLADATALQTAGLLPNNFTPATGRNFGTRFSGPEEVEVFEAGLKGRFDWGAFNLAVFDQTIDNFQSTIFQGTGFVLANAGSQSTRGIEFDSTFTPVEGLALGVAGIWQDPEYDDFQGAPVVTGGELDLADGVADGVGDLSGFQPAGINELSMTFSAQYEFTLSDRLDAFIRGDYQYEDEVQVVDNIVGVDRDTSIFNGSLGFTFDETLDVRFWGRNLFDHETFTSAFPGVVQAGTVNAYPNQPRTYGVSVRKSF
ncbi:TonB-dependent receptor [Litorimonas sp. WD9-15]|uniref:TonB-dependent receptor n=1 Tax=Litorimonas sp. WD9-15 TaxID=3418716 RepID=UPI003D06BF32